MYAVNPLLETLAAAGDKHNAPELATLIIVPVVLAVVLYRVAAKRVKQGTPRAALWASEVPLLFGIYLAYGPFQDIRSDSYRLFYSVTDRSVALHYATFIIPCAAAVLLAAYILYGQYREKMEQ